MSERGNRPSDLDLQPTWAKGPSEYTSTFPPSGKRQVGWQPKDEPTPGTPGEIFPADYENGINEYLMDVANYVDAVAVREFTDVQDAIEAVTTPQRFAVYSDPLKVPWGGTPVVGQGSGSVGQVTTDGQYVYYVRGSTTYAANLRDLSALSGFTAITSRSRCFTDGLYLYGANGITTEIAATIYNRATGATVGSLSYDGTNNMTFNQLTANGSYAAAAMQYYATTGHAGSIWSGVGSSPTKVADIASTGANLECCCMDHDTVYFGGDRDPTGSYSVAAYDLATGVQKWTTNLGTAITVNGLATDGELVYGVSDLGTYDALSGSPTAHAFSVNRVDGVIVWTKYWSPNTVYWDDGTDITVDDRYLYIGGNTSLANYRTIVTKKEVPSAVVAVIDDYIPGPASCEGTSVVTAEFGGSGVNVQRLFRGGGSRLFVRVDGDDPNRRPIFNLAQPTQGG